MNILLTGATGFVGVPYLQKLLSDGHNVCTLGRREPKNKAIIEHFHFDISSGNEIPLLLKSSKIDLCIHLAWSSLNNFKSEAHLDQVLPSHQRFLSQLMSIGIRRFQVFGTCLEYQEADGEMLENQFRKSSELAYAKAKTHLYQWLIADKHNQVQWLRAFYLFGKQQNPNSFLPLLLAAIEREDDYFPMSLGEQRLDYLWIENAVDMAAQLLSHNAVGAYNLSSGQPTVLLDLAKYVLELKGSDLVLDIGKYDYNDWEPRRFWGNNKKLQAIIDDPIPSDDLTIKTQLKNYLSSIKT